MKKGRKYGRKVEKWVGRKKGNNEESNKMNG